MENKFFVDQKSLMAVLSSMQPIASKRTTLDATTSILFQVGHKELVLKATDLEISLQASYLLKQSSMNESRSFLVSGKRIFDVIKELDGEIEFLLENDQLVVKAGKVNLALHIKDAQEFPPFPERIENLMHLDSAFLLTMLNKVAFQIPQNNANPALNGLYLEIGQTGMTMTSTDGHCLAQLTTEKYSLEEPKKWLMPRRAVFEVKKILESSEDAVIFLGVCGNQLVFSGDSFNFFTKVLADPFPQYRAILDKKDFLPAKIDRSHFVKTLRRSSCLLSGQFLATKFGFAEHSLNVSMQNKEVGKLEEELPLKDFTGADLAIRFYAPYLLNGLQVFNEDMLTFYLKDSSRPIIFESHESEFNFLYLVMPVAPTHAG
ncbi:MAG: DNA polymerase III subunit beta [Candidatus Dependentiae bacterium]|nr:DNA polymerase III subunit beta [Candidatus Dependentiae bacterium]